MEPLYVAPVPENYWALVEKNPNPGTPLKAQIIGNVYLHVEDVVAFVEGAQNGVGLSISSWKKEGWDQRMAEGMLNLLEGLHLVTERTQGRAAEWTEKSKTGERLSFGKVMRHIIANQD